MYVLIFKNNLSMDRPYLPEEQSANLSRDWPDARGLWINNNGTLAAKVNHKDHISIASCDNTSDVQEVFGDLYSLTKTVRLTNFKQRYRMHFFNKMIF